MVLIYYKLVRLKIFKILNMLDQLTKLLKEYGNEAVVKNTAIPNEHNDAVLQETSNTIVSTLKNYVSQGNYEVLGQLFQNNNQDTPNAAVQDIKANLTESLTQKFGINSETASGVAGSLIPKVLSELINSAKDPNNSSISIQDIIGSLSGSGTANGGLMDAISKYGGQFGLDQNVDGKVDFNDAIAAVTKKSGGFGGLLGKIFGKN